MTLDELREMAKRELEMTASTERLAKRIGTTAPAFATDVLARAVIAMADVVAHAKVVCSVYYAASQSPSDAALKRSLRDLDRLLTELDTTGGAK